MWNRIHIALMLACTMCACSARHHISPFSLGVEWDEARHTLDVADSLRVNEGRLYDDSLALAEAYTLLGHWRLIYPDDYARACYYYGRMLRSRGDQVSAMRAFIAGSHAPYVSRVVPLPWFSDYHILGRIYSNMGTMCHLDEDYVHAYEMYQKSASLFILSYDSTAYYYALNSMAFCMAMQMNRNETLRLINDIQSHCLDSNVLAKTWETKAIMYETFEVHDSAIIAINNMYNPEIFGTTAYTIKAQAFSHIGIHDSALYYAQRVMANSSASYQDMYNALYILTNKDSLLISSAKDSLIAIRADIGICRRNEANLLGHAVEQVLHDDNIQPKSIIVTRILIFMLIIIVLLCVFRIIKHRQIQKVHHIIHKAHNIDERTKKQERRYLEKELSILDEIELVCSALKKSNNLNEIYWDNYLELCACVNKRFYSLADKLKEQYDLSEREVRLCILVFIGFSRKRISELLHYSLTGVGKLKDTTAKKIGTSGADLRSFLLKLATI